MGSQIRKFQIYVGKMNVYWSNYSQSLNQQSEQILRGTANGRSILNIVDSWIPKNKATP